MPDLNYEAIEAEYNEGFGHDNTPEIPHTAPAPLLTASPCRVVS